MIDKETKLREALRWALEWIDAVPEDAVLPAMPGFDRDYVNELLATTASIEPASRGAAQGRITQAGCGFDGCPHGSECVHASPADAGGLTRDQIIEASGNALLAGYKPGSIDYDVALIREAALLATKAAQPDTAPSAEPESWDFYLTGILPWSHRIAPNQSQEVIADAMQAELNDLRAALRKAHEFMQLAAPSAKQPARDIQQLANWLLVDPEGGGALTFAGPLEAFGVGLSQVKMMSQSGNVWTLVAGLREGYKSEAERSANLLRIVGEELAATSASASPAAPSVDALAAAPIPADPVAQSGHDEAVFLLSAIFDAWENGDDCYEEGDPDNSYMGKCFNLDDDIFKRSCDLLNRVNPPRNVAAIPQETARIWRLQLENLLANPMPMPMMPPAVFNAASVAHREAINKARAALAASPAAAVAAPALAPVAGSQQVPAQFTEKMLAAGGRYMADNSAEVCNVNKDDNWKEYGDEFVVEFKGALDAALAAAPAVPVPAEQSQPFAYLPKSELAKLDDPRIAGVGMMVSKEPAEHRVAIYLAAPSLQQGRE